jgi:peptide deformylase
VAVGVPANHSGIRQELKALIYKEDGTEPKQKRKIPINPIITLIDLRQEEDRDQEIIN